MEVKVILFLYVFNFIPTNALNNFDGVLLPNDDANMDPLPHTPIVLYRLLGNDMPPLEKVGQVRENTEYALLNEPLHLPKTERRWILNRIVNETEHQLLKELLASHGFSGAQVLDIPFQKTKFCHNVTTEESLLYVTNQNAARNLAFQQGIMDNFRWIMVFDGNGFVSHDIWNRIVHSLEEAESYNKKVVEIPMVRLNYPQRVNKVNATTTIYDLYKYSSDDMSSSLLGSFTESQLAIRNDLLPLGHVPYENKLGYGHMNKQELFALCGHTIWGRDGKKVSVQNNEFLREMSKFWTPNLCHCSSVIARLAWKESFRMHNKNSDPYPGIHDGKWKRMAEKVRRSNLKIVRQCGLWLRLWPWPEEKDSLEILKKKKNCIRGGTRSLTEDCACRGALREVSKKNFADNIKKIRSQCENIN
eukprot:g882.t1